MGPQWSYIMAYMSIQPIYVTPTNDIYDIYGDIYGQYTQGSKGLRIDIDS